MISEYVTCRKKHRIKARLCLEAMESNVSPPDAPARDPCAKYLLNKQWKKCLVTRHAWDFTWCLLKVHTLIRVTAGSKAKYIASNHEYKISKSLMRNNTSITYATTTESINNTSAVSNVYFCWRFPSTIHASLLFCSHFKGKVAFEEVAFCRIISGLYLVFFQNPPLLIIFLPKLRSVFLVVYLKYLSIFLGLIWTCFSRLTHFCPLGELYTS